MLTLRGLASYITLIFSYIFLLVGWAFESAVYAQVGIGFSILYLATEFRHFYEDWQLQ